MPGSTGRGYPYPLPSEGPDGPGAFQNLAAAIDSDVSGNLAPMAKLITRSSGSSTFATATFTTVAGWDLSPYDKGGITVSAGVFTVPSGVSAQLFEWSMTLTTPATTPAYVYNARVLVNNAANASGQVQANVPSNSASQSISAGGPLVLNAGDTVTLQFRQDSGAAMAVTQVSAMLARIAA